MYILYGQKKDQRGQKGEFSKETVVLTKFVQVMVDSFNFLAFCYVWVHYGTNQTQRATQGRMEDFYKRQQSRYIFCKGITKLQVVLDFANFKVPYVTNKRQ